MKLEEDIELRSEILDAALNLEHAIDQLLIALLMIENPKRKAITNRSGSLSFKNKIDLLFDLEILSSEEHNKLLLLMEFRNQFLHNIECSSFVIAVRLLGNDKEKRLLQFYDEGDEHENEYKYKSGFKSLYLDILKLVREKIKNRRDQIENRSKLHIKLIEAQIFFIDRYFEVLKRIAEVCETEAIRDHGVARIVDRINDTISDDIESISATDEYAQIMNELRDLHTAEKIKSYFKK